MDQLAACMRQAVNLISKKIGIAFSNSRLSSIQCLPSLDRYRLSSFKEALIKSFDRFGTNGKLLIPFVVSLSNHEWNQFVQRFLNYPAKL
jgi:hypothetical protein